MPEIKKALVTAYLKPENQERLKAALEPAEVTFCIPYGPDAKEKNRTGSPGSRCVYTERRFK